MAAALPVFFSSQAMNSVMVKVSGSLEPAPEPVVGAGEAAVSVAAGALDSAAAAIWSSSDELRDPGYG